MALRPRREPTKLQSLVTAHHLEVSAQGGFGHRLHEEGGKSGLPQNIAKMYS